MIPINDMRFRERKQKNGDITLCGELTFGHCRRILADEIKNVRFNPVEYAKQEMRKHLWRKAYAELQEPIRELCFLARVYLPMEHAHRANELRNQIETMLDPPTPVAAKEGPSNE